VAVAEEWAKRKAAAFMRQDARRRLQAAIALFDQHGGKAVLAAVKICAEHQLLLPDKLAREFVRRVNLVFNRKAKSWDDAFGEPWPSGRSLASLQIASKGLPVLLRTRIAVEGGSGVDAALRDVAAELGLSHGEARKLYYAFPKEYWAIPRRSKIRGKTNRAR
jgi:hypothetical protein